MEIQVPDLGESVVEATIVRWLKSEGDRVSVGEALVELETDKVNLEVGAEKEGVLTTIARGEGEDVQVGDVLGTIDAGAAPESQEAEQAEPVTQAASPSERQMYGSTPTANGPTAPDTAAKASPVARRMADEHGVDLEQVEGTGPRAKVTREDIERAISTKPSAPPKKEEAPPKQEAPLKPQRDDEERIRMSRRRRTIATRLVEAQQTAAMLTTFNEIDMSAVMELRGRTKQDFQEKHGVKLGLTSFFVKAVIGGLKAFPRLNAEIDGDEMVLKYHYDIGVAIGDPEGLIVPVLRNADRMSFVEIERHVRELVDAAQEGSLSIEDLRGGTFTITNGGIFGSMLSTPILNPPQVGILGLHNIEQRPVVVDGEIVIRPMMYVALSYDHRIVDGREAVQYLVRVKELIEDPEKLLLEG